MNLIIPRKGERRTDERYAGIQKFFKRTVREPEGTGKSNQRKGLREIRGIDCKDVFYHISLSDTHLHKQTPLFYPQMPLHHPLSDLILSSVRNIFKHF